MKRIEYVDKILKMQIDENSVASVEGVYKKEIPDIIKRIISNCNETIFFDDEYRVLSITEIIDAEKDLHVDFKNKGLIPILDCGENDFIVYNFADCNWYKFNIIDECLFKKKSSLMELLK